MRLAAFLICLALPVQAQSPEAAAGTAMDRLLAARTQLEQAQTKRDRVKALTETVQAYEDGLAAMRDGLRQVATREAALTAELSARRDELSDLIGALQAIGRTPTPVLQSHPQGPLAAARAGGIVADLTPALETQVSALQEQLSELDRLRTLRIKAAETLTDGREAAQTARTALGIAISERTDLPQRFSEDSVQTALLVASAETLDGFARGLAGSLPSSDTGLTAEGNLPLPVAGYVLPDNGQGRPGVRIAAQPQALVTTPVAATLLFHGAVLDYGSVVILEPAADVLFIIAGMEQTFGTAGQILPAGEAIGLMGGNGQADDGILSENAVFDDDQTQQTLYLEVRSGQSPVNPDTWFALE
ncbi:murein hydrolase activator EnvC family protein [Yoonia sp. SDW83-1]|uniref:murein hydrolase activator EnvC family protein n=1 Tax=Yoonia sp. SDW83-1 TaxID=3366945 RepID=UPI00398C81DC